MTITDDGRIKMVEKNMGNGYINGEVVKIKGERRL